MADPVAYGLHSVRVLLSRNPGRVQRVLLASDREAGRHAEIRMLAERAGVKVATAADAELDKLADGGHAGARALATYWVGQGVGMMNNTLSVRAVVQEFKEDFLAAYERLSAFVESVG